MRRDVDVIDILRNANPVPPGSVVGSARLEEALGSSLGREDLMSSTITRPAEQKKSLPWWPKYLGAGAAVIAVAATALALVIRPSDPSVVWGATSVAQREIIEQVVEVVNAGDAAGFAEAFAPGATFSTHLDFEARASCCDAYDVQDADLVAAWMAVDRAWEMEAVLESCQPTGGNMVECRMRVRWHNLQMEIAERWIFSFGEAGLRTFGILLDDLQPSERAMPLHFYGLEEWEAWLEETDPEEFERLLVYDEPFERSIDGRPFYSNILRYDPALADDIRASIDEYLATS